MLFREVKSERIRDKYYVMNHSSGLKIYVYPKEGFSSTYAVIGTKFGSINTKFKKKGDKKVTVVPDGIAHYLEHKLFESEDGDAFAKYAKTGASANAYTSFDMTCYLFSCTENFGKSLKILLELVQSPYFTKETVAKEQGIIGQEIKMYDDDPNWRVMFNLLGAMFHNHPVKVDIAGTIESIAQINADNLYECYNNFYNLNNMVLAVAGNVTPDEVLKIANESLKPSENSVPESIFPDEPYEVVKERVEQKFEISMPMFQFGFKELAAKDRFSAKELAQTDIILQILAAKSSPMYRELLDKSLINDSFSYEYFEGPGYAAIIFSGESKNPDEVANIIKKYVKDMHEKGIDKDEFEMSKRAIYGKTVSMLNSAENISNAIMGLDFANRSLFESIDCIASTTLQDVENRLKKQLDINNCALSVVLPLKEDRK